MALATTTAMAERRTPLADVNNSLDMLTGIMLKGQALLQSRLQFLAAARTRIPDLANISENGKAHHIPNSYTCPKLTRYRLLCPSQDQQYRSLDSSVDNLLSLFDSRFSRCNAHIDEKLCLRGVR